MQSIYALKNNFIEPPIINYQQGIKQKAIQGLQLVSPRKNIRIKSPIFRRKIMF